MEAGTIVKWHKKEGETIKGGDLLFEVATDKATVEHNSLDDGFMRKILVNEGEEALVNQAVAIFTPTKDESIEGYEPEGIKPHEAEPEGVVEEAVVAKPRAGASVVQPSFIVEEPLEDYSFEFDTSYQERLAASPLAKKLAKRKGVDLSTVKGSGPDGRVMSRDLDLAQPDSPTPFDRSQMPQEKPGSYLSEPMSPMRKAIGEKLQASKSFIPHFYLQQDVDVEAMIEMREQLKKTGVNVTYNDFIMRATALALKEHPVVNSGFDSANNAIVRFQTIDIALAVTIEEGLITPILRHVDFKNLGQISAEVKQLAGQAKRGELQPHQYRGGSFTVSNLGMYGIHDFQAIINPPQVSILAIGGIRECAVVKNGEVVPGKRMMLSLSSDHRVVDGVDGAKFIKTLQKFLENPTVLLI